MQGEGRRVIGAGVNGDLGEPEGAPLKPDFRIACEYSDCWVDDARLVVLTALDAAERGARILTRCPCTAARRDGGCWTVSMRDEATKAGLRVDTAAYARLGEWMAAAG